MDADRKQRDRGGNPATNNRVRRTRRSVEPMSPEERSLQARVAAHVLHSRRDSRETTAAARAAFDDQFTRDVDPDGVLDPVERERRKRHAKAAYYARLALASARERRRKRDA
jgi:hypothetical protein